MSRIEDLAQIEIPLKRDLFLRTLIGHLAETIEDVVGLTDAAGLISVVGQKIGEELDDEYRRALALPQFSAEQVADVLVDLKQRIQGDFYIMEQTEEKIVLGNRACPFGQKVIGRESLCMMTSNVFGTIAAENLGYAKIELAETIARGNGRCHIVIHLQPTATAEAACGREYYRT